MLVQSKRGENFVDSGIKILTAVVIGALLLGGLYEQVLRRIAEHTGIKFDDLTKGDLIMIMVGYAVIKVFFVSIKRGGILLIQIAVGSLYMFSVPRGLTDGYVMW